MRKYKNKFLALLCVICICQVVQSQSIENIYINMPDALNPIVGKAQRHELLEYFKVNQSDSVTNRFGRQTRIVKLDTINENIIVNNSASSEFQLMKLYNKDSTVFVGLINTVCAPVCQSNIQFYDTAWNKLPTKFQMPKSIDWLNSDSLSISVLDPIWVRNVLENSFVKLKFDSTLKLIIAENFIIGFLSDEDSQKIQQVLDPVEFKYFYRNKVWIKE